MATNLGGGDDWILVSTAVARMSELHWIYRTYPGLARRDLETAILAGRMKLRGCPNWPPKALPLEITGPITSSLRLDLIHNRISKRRPGPSGDEVWLCDVEIEWTKGAEYLLAVAVEGTAAEAASRSGAAAPRSSKRGAAAKPSGRPPKQLEKVRSYIRENFPNDEVGRTPLKDIARATNTHVSTVARALRRKK